MPTSWPRSRLVELRRLVAALLVALGTSACAGGSSGAQPRPAPVWLEERSGVLRVLRSEGIDRCRGLVESSAPGSRSHDDILRVIAREVGVDGSHPRDIAGRVGRELAGPSAARGPVDAATEGCLLGLRQGLEARPG